MIKTFARCFSSTEMLISEHKINLHCHSAVIHAHLRLLKVENRQVLLLIIIKYSILNNEEASC